MSDLLELAMSAHGGLDRWREIKTLDLRMSLTGSLFRIKGYPEGVPNVLMHVDTQRIAVDTSPWTGVGTVGHFIPDRVWITDGERRVVEDRRQSTRVLRRPRPFDPVGPIAAPLFYKLRLLELSLDSVPFHASRF